MTESFLEFRERKEICNLGSKESQILISRKYQIRFVPVYPGMQIQFSLGLDFGEKVYPS